MSRHAFGALIDIESASQPIPDPPLAHKKPLRSLTSIELADYAREMRNNPIDLSTPIAELPIDTTQLTASHPPSPRRHEAAPLVQSWTNPSGNKWRIYCSCLAFFGAGMNDSAAGALLPYMESDFHIGYAVVSLIFVTNALGFLSAAFFNDILQSKLGRQRTLMLAEILMISGFVLVVSPTPFPVVVLAFLLIGLALSIILAICNVFAANLAKSSIVLGSIHGAYGVGGIVGPIIATSLVSRNILWSRYYLTTLGIRVLTMVFVGFAWHGYEAEDGPLTLLTALERTASRIVVSEAGMAEPTKLQLLNMALKNRVTIIGALFIFAYQGAEVSISGWMISFLITYRQGDPAKVGYVTAGFWAGITLGRFLLTPFAHRWGEKIFVYFLGAGSIAFQLLVWLIPNIIGDAVAVAVLGLLLGPVYPCATTIFSRLLPRSMQTTSMSFIASAGSSGGAVAPFTTGLLAQAAGTFVLHPVCIGLFAAMLGCWYALPSISKREE